MPTVLLIDDEPSLAAAVAAVVRQRGYEFVGTADGSAGLDRFRADRPDVVICDLLLPDRDGLDVVREITALDPTVPVVVISGRDSTSAVIEANALGVFDYLPKPFTVAGLSGLLDRAVAAASAARTPARVAVPAARAGGADEMVGRCPAMCEVYKAVGRVAQQRVTVLVVGESGTGKELVARAIHRYSGRADRPLVAVNCAAVPEPLIESELFGHEKGAFTGADRRHAGKFEQADGGTLFLDEVGELPAPVQAKFLRVLQDQAFERVGGGEVVRTDVRVIAATNRRLEDEVAGGRFREDLFYRLSGYTIPLPPLRDRADDLIPLVSYFLGRLAVETGRVVAGLSEDAVAKLRAYPWPGNLRELQGALRRAILRATGPLLTGDLFDLGATDPFPAAAPADEGAMAFVAARLGAGTRDLYAEWLARSEPMLLRQVLTHFDGNLTRAAEALGMNRMTLRSRVRQYGLADVSSAKK